MSWIDAEVLLVSLAAMLSPTSLVLIGEGSMMSGVTARSCVLSPVTR